MKKKQSKSKLLNKHELGALLVRDTKMQPYRALINNMDVLFRAYWMFYSIGKDWTWKKELQEVLCPFNEKIQGRWIQIEYHINDIVVMRYYIRFGEKVKFLQYFIQYIDKIISPTFTAKPISYKTMILVFRKQIAVKATESLEPNIVSI